MVAVVKVRSAKGVALAVIQVLQTVFGAEGSLGQTGHNFFEGVSVVAEALAELTVEPLGRPCGVPKFMASR